MSAAPKCANCGDTGSNPGSEYLDCIKCEAASQRKDLNVFVRSLYSSSGISANNFDWLIHQRAYAMGVTAAEARTVLTDDAVLRNALEEAVEIIKDLEQDSQCNYGGEIFMDDVIRFRAILAASAAPKVKP